MILLGVRRPALLHFTQDLEVLSQCHWISKRQLFLSHILARLLSYHRSGALLLLKLTLMLLLSFFSLLSLRGQLRQTNQAYELIVLSWFLQLVIPKQRVLHSKRRNARFVLCVEITHQVPHSSVITSERQSRSAAQLCFSHDIVLSIMRTSWSLQQRKRERVSRWSDGE